MKKRNLLSIIFALIVAVILIAAKPVKAQVDFTWTDNCLNSPTLFTPTGVSIGTIASYYWEFGDGNTSTAQNTQHQYYSPGNYIVTLTVIDTSSVTSSVSHPVTIIPPPIAHFSVPANNCEDTPTLFINQSTALIGYIVRWTWDFGDGNMLVVNFPSVPDVIHTYEGAGIFNASLTVKSSDSCENTEMKVIDIHSTPTSFFSFTGPSCSNTPVQFIDLSSVVYGYITKWIWNFGDGSPNDTVAFPNDPHVTHQFPTPGTYYVTLTVINSVSCTNSFTSPVTVNTACYANFMYSGSFVNQQVSFSDLSVCNGTASVVSWNWNFGDPASGVGNTSNLPNPQHIYVNPGTYIVSEMVTNSIGCVDTIMQTLVINPVTSIDFTYLGQCANSPTQFTPVLNGATITQYNWDFGDGNTSTVSNPAHTYSNYGTFTVTLTVTDNFGVISTISHSVTINPSPITNFTFSQTCLGLPVLFSDLSQAGSGSIVQWLWNFGDPTSGVLNASTVQNPQHIYTAAGTYSVQLIAISSSGCTDTIVKTVLIHALPPVDFSVSNNCINAAVTFSPNSTVMNFASIASWLWNFGDGATSTLQNPTHIYPIAGNYTVTLSVTDTIGCTNSFSKMLSIYAIPMAAFSFSQPVCNQSEVAFTDISQTNGGGAIISWQWAFGDPASGTANTSSLQNPVHIFNSPGAYIVSLTISNANACSSLVMLSIQVHQIPTAAFTFTAPQLNEPVQFMDQSTAGSAILTSWNWDFGDGNSSALQNPTHSYSMPGNYTVFLTVTTNEGCTNQVDSLLVVPPGASSITLNGRVFAGNQTINTAVVRLIKIDNTGLPVSVGKTSPGSNSYFVFENVPEGSYYLQAYPLIGGPAASIFLPTFYINSVYWQSATLINLGQAQNPYDIHLVAYDIVNGGTLTINGQLINTGKSINTAEQEVLLLDDQNNPIRWTFTDLAGNFSFDSLPAGNYAVTPVIIGLTSYPFYVTLNESTSPAFVKMIISGLIITSSKETENTKQEYRIYPNPADEVLNIEINGLSDTYKSEIVSTAGKTVKSVQLNNGFNTIYINTLPPGLYLIKITDTKGSEYIQRFIRQ